MPWYKRDEYSILSYPLSLPSPQTCVAHMWPSRVWTCRILSRKRKMTWYLAITSPVKMSWSGHGA